MIRDAWLATIRRWRSTAFSIAAIAIGLMAVVATLGIAQSGAHNVATTLRTLTGTTAEIRISDTRWEAEEVLVARLRQVPGVDGGTVTTLPIEVTQSLPVSTARADGTGSLRVVIASPHGLRARGVQVTDGVIPDPTSLQRDPGTVLLGTAAARRLAAAPVPGLDRLQIGSSQATVAGVLRESGTTSALDNALILSPATAEYLGLLPAQQSLFVRHTGDPDGAALRAAADPARPEEVTVEVSASPESLQATISADTTTLVAVLTVVTITASGIGVANTMLTSVWQRRTDIGILRAIGASRHRVGTTFLVEAGLIGLLGGLAGTILGVLVGAAIARLQDWAYALPLVALTAPAVGLLVGMTFGLVPAWRAAAVDPAELLRSP